MAQHVYLTRHGDTQLNDKRLIRGWLDVPLSQKGVQSAKEAGKKLAKEGVQGIATSDLIRAIDTANFISEYTDAPVLSTRKSLRTWNLGVLTGTPSDEADKEIKVYIEKNPDKAVPDGESFNDYKKRLLDSFQEVLEKNKKLNMVVVNHHSGVAVIQTWIKQGAPEDYKIDPKVMSRAMTSEQVKPGEFIQYNGIWSRDQKKMV